MKALVAAALCLLVSVSASANEPDVVCTDADGATYELDHEIGTLTYKPKSGTVGVEAGLDLIYSSNGKIVRHNYSREAGDTVLIITFPIESTEGKGILAYGTELDCTRKSL